MPSMGGDDKKEDKAEDTPEARAEKEEQVLEGEEEVMEEEEEMLEEEEEMLEEFGLYFRL